MVHGSWVTVRGSWPQCQVLKSRTKNPWNPRTHEPHEPMNLMDLTTEVSSPPCTASRSASKRSSRSSTRRRGSCGRMSPSCSRPRCPVLGDQIKRELHQSIVEVGTRICADVSELRDEIFRIRHELVSAAERAGLAVAAAGTHPFSHWKDQVISPGVRYDSIVEELQQLARSLLIFGLHVHVAVPDRTTMIDLMNEVRYFLPHLLALSTSSPFWMGRDTGLKSYRTTIFRRFPRTGVPDHFGSWSDYESYVRLLVDLHCMDDAKKIWWDVRPHPTFGTLEFRVCDVPTRPEVAVMLGGADPGDHRQAVPAARPQPGLPALSPGADRREQVARGALGPRRQADRLRQARGSADARPRARAARASSTTWWTISSSRWAVDYVHTVLREGTSADRQLAVYRETGDLQGRRPRHRRADANRTTAEGCRDEWSTRRRADEGRTALRPRVQLSAGVHRAGQRGGRAARDHRGDGQARAAPRWTSRREYRVIVDRISHEVEYYRGALKHAVLQGCLRHQQPVLVDGRRQVLQLLGDGQARASRSRAPCCCRRRAIRPTSTSRAESLRNLALPDRLGRPARLRRPAGHPQAVFGRRLEARLQGQRQGASCSRPTIGRRRTA